ncbi:hypothetical protein EYR41_006469 [Orbilia oligospora]|uniref:Uncharacterized protein n=1 Tax=Orbilia oligospora TaxID=2813651 RepID=A0A7C8TRK5_ORBOL|nr:hypothetical protein TWF751_001962 [Orbilia oligospora]TGJ67334.1 hypothetical protein EYR41_006469 [Orbilia oligospora]
MENISKGCKSELLESNNREHGATRLRELGLKLGSFPENVMVDEHEDAKGGALGLLGPCLFGDAELLTCKLLGCRTLSIILSFPCRESSKCTNGILFPRTEWNEIYYKRMISQ